MELDLISNTGEYKNRALYELRNVLAKAKRMKLVEQVSSRPDLSQFVINAKPEVPLKPVPQNRNVRRP